MLHPHLWVRSCVDRLLGRYFGYCSDRAPFSSGSDVHAKSALWLSQNGVMFELAATLCKQLQSRMLDDALAEQIVKNLVFLSTQLLRLPHLTPADAITKSNGDVAEDERDADAPSISGERAPLHWLVRRLSFMARKAAAKNHIRVLSISRAVLALTHTRRGVFSSILASLVPKFSAAKFFLSSSFLCCTPSIAFPSWKLDSAKKHLKQT